MQQQNRPDKTVNHPSTEKINGKPGPFWDKLFMVGVIGLGASMALPALPEPIHLALRWICIPLIILPAAIRIKWAVDQVKVSRTGRAHKIAPDKSRRKGKAKKPIEFPLALYLLSAAIFALGLSLIFLLPHGYSSYRLQSQASSWPQTTGEVVSAEVVEQESLSSDEDMYQPKIVTRYAVNGRTYVIREIRFNQSLAWSNSYNRAAKVVNKYRPGTQVPVYYDPKQPSQAVLDTSTNWFSIFIMGLGGVLAVLGIYWFWLALRDTFIFAVNLIGRFKKT